MPKWPYSTTTSSPDFRCLAAKHSLFITVHTNLVSDGRISPVLGTRLRLRSSPFRQILSAVRICGPKSTISALLALCTSTEAKTSIAQRLKQMFPFPLPHHTEIRPPVGSPTTKLVVVQSYFATILSR